MAGASKPHPSRLYQAWRVASWIPRAYVRAYGKVVTESGKALDAPGIKREWDRTWTLIQEVRRQVLTKHNAPASGIRLVEKDGRLDLEATRAGAEAHFRQEFAAGRATQADIDIWRAVPLSAVAEWAVYEVQVNKQSVYMPMVKAGFCAVAALLSAWLAAPLGMAIMSSVTLLLFGMFFAVISIRAVRNQAYLEGLIERTSRR